MLKSIIKKNIYQDSVNLMLLTKKINTVSGVNQSSIMMGTDANKDILKNTNMITDEVMLASPSDMVIVLDTENEKTISTVMDEIENFLTDLSEKKVKKNIKEITNFDDALEIMPSANIALFSIPGEYGYYEMKTALNKGLNVFSFTDNIPIDEELKLKKLAHSKGLLMMGPDCGTGILSGVPLAFTNVVKTGNIGVIGASGTGIQEVTTIIDRLGSGVINAIGIGGHDLNSDIGGITAKDALYALENDEKTDVIVFISKPPAKKVRDEILNIMFNLSKPVVSVFIGENPNSYENNVYLASNLEECAKIAVDLSNMKDVKEDYTESLKNSINIKIMGDDKIVGLYSGGTLANEAAMIIRQNDTSKEFTSDENFVLKGKGYEIIDLGDDKYTIGKPHPMIDPETRVKMLMNYAKDKDCKVILMDCINGFGSHENMAEVLAPAIIEAKKIANLNNKELNIVLSVCGTKNDPQNYEDSIKILEEAGAYVEDTNVKAIRLALKFKGLDFYAKNKRKVEKKFEKINIPKPSEEIVKLLNEKPQIINIGLESFYNSLVEQGIETVNMKWKPIANGNKQLINLISQIEDEQQIQEYNEEVINRIKNSQPFLVDVVEAKSVISILNERTLLHAGPPIEYKNMTGPMQGACIGAVLYEKWATTEEEAKKLLENSEINFEPCHHHNAVGPMGGITSGNMPVLVVVNKIDNTTSYCIMNEGIGKVLRFGAYSQEVIDRLNWMEKVLAPTLSKALKNIENGLNLNVIISKAIAMGDEFHQRNIAASLVFLKEIVPYITEIDMNQKDKEDVIQFLADTDQFFLNIMMAAGKSIVDYARKIENGTVVTTMTRNGENFGIRISGMVNEWFTAPVNTPSGLYFSGYSEEDANSDIGDSAITETVGVGAMATIAAPAVTRFVGSGGGYDDALELSEKMNKICISNNSNWSIPNWNFKGTSLGIDLVKVVKTGITPIINTGIAHKTPGIGQIGAGTVKAPYECFEKALIAYGKKIGIK